MSFGMNCGMYGRLIKMIASGGSRGLTKFQGKCLNDCSLHNNYFIGNSLVSSPYWGPALSFLHREGPVQKRAKEDDQRTSNPNSRCLFQEISHLPEVTLQRVSQHQCSPELSPLTIRELIESECVDCQQFLLVMYQYVGMLYLQYDSASSFLFCLETLGLTVLYGLRGG